MLSRTVDGSAIREQRELAGMTVKEVQAGMAELGVTVTIGTIYYIERGGQTSAKKVVTMAKVIGCDPELFVTKQSDAA
jgi:transcriptional regulator with XRE-family HTH domain